MVDEKTVEEVERNVSKVGLGRHIERLLLAR